ncbi:BTB/POZ domain-containing protein [Rhizophagus clarus]|uniref:BTB/POZ domain-containing protein n=1 Tax=Rhizophagus clarus TaxID=94130 RepID=A0A8H3QHU5_9GLOM|nr:BTB/POZ domain-containing protein [Rhizophagus clarus]
MSFEFSQELINDWEKLLETEKGYDVIIYVGEDENIKEFRAHSIVLCTRSQYFHAALFNEWANKNDGKFIFNKPNFSPQIFKVILRFIYCGNIDLTKLQGPELLNLLIAVDELGIQTLIPCIQEYLFNHRYEFLQKNPIEIFEIVYQVYRCDTFAKLMEAFLEAICGSPEILLNYDYLIRLNAPLLELLIKSDDLSLDEIDIWDSLVKWCLAQHPSIQHDIKKWNKEEISIMGRTLHKFIPLIRFYHINSKDFFLRVYPFKILIPDDTIDNVLAFHMVPNKEFNLNIQPPRKPLDVYDSIIIGPQHFAIFASWIEKKNNSYDIRNVPYKFNLLFRANRDGNTSAAFHAKCDNKGATIVIIKIPNSEHIVGGYNSLYWNSTCNDWKSAKNSFLFSFMSRNDLNSAKVAGHINEDGYGAIYCSQDYGPAFGRGHDLFQDIDGTWKNYVSTYPKIDVPQGNREWNGYNVFNVENYEVFQVIKK